MVGAHGQFWADAGIVIDNVGQVNSLYVDTVHNKLYGTGAWVDDWGQPNQSLRYVVKDENGWSLSVPLSDYTSTIVNYHDTLFIGGPFTHVDGIALPNAACLVDGVWQSCGSFNWPVWKFRVIEDTLYAVGYFSMIDGNPCQSVAKRVGNGWQCVGDLDCDFCGVFDVAKYQGRLVVSGTITFDGVPYLHIVQHVNGNWVPVGPQGIYGGLSGAGPMAVYHDELYVGGLIPLSAGNAGFAIQKWNGSAWSQVGEGLQDETGGALQDIKVKDLLVHDGKLFVCGGFTYAGHEYAPKIATWDGVQWCSVGGDFGENEVTAMAFYNDTLYIGCGLDAVVDGQQIVGVAKFTAPEFENNCSGNASVLSPNAPDAPRLVALGSGRYRLEGISEGGAVTFLDALGREVAQHVVVGDEVFQVRRLSSGMTLVRLPNGMVQRLVNIE